MNVIIENTQQLYDYMTAFREHCEDKGIGQTAESGEFCVRRNGLASDDVSLPAPLVHLFSRARFVEGLCVIDIILAGKNSGVFRGVSDVFGKSFKGEDFLWKPVDLNGVGYVVKKGERVPTYAIAGAASEPMVGHNVRVVSLGGHGSASCPLGDFERFTESIAKLEGLASAYIRSVYSLTAKGKRELERFEDIDFALDCLI